MSGGFHGLVLGGVLIASAPVLAQDDAGQSAGDAEDAFAAFDAFDDEFESGTGGLVWTGFVEGAYGQKLDADERFGSRQSLGDLRVRAETEWAGDRVELGLKLDALYDNYASELALEARELSLAFSPAAAIDMKLGRQVLTWGTGDLVFLNDLFPKSWVSFFSGRDDEYLKAPSDAVRLTWYRDAINVDVVWSPRFDPDEYLTGERFAFFSPLARAVVAPQPPLAGMQPARSLNNGELALRLFRTVGSTEYAAYFYRGFFKRPLGLSADSAPIFPRLRVWGGSLRRPLGEGIVNAEFAWHDSRSEPDGTDPAIPNDELRLLLGYEFEARARLNIGFQYYVERTLDHRALIARSPYPAFERDRTRTVITNRLTWRSERDTLTLSLFTFYSPSDDDRYLRPVVSYRHSDEWTVSAGANLFGGARDFTFFGQLEDNSNAYVRVRWSY